MRILKKTATGKGYDYTTCYLLDYPYFKENYKMIAIDLSKQQRLDAGPRAIKQISFTADLNRAGNITTFFIVKEGKDCVRLFTRNYKSFVNVL